MNRARVSLLIFFVLGISRKAGAAVYYVAPDGSGERCSRATPCALDAGVTRAQAGDTVVLQDGVYKQGLVPTNSGTADAWITFQADECALPIIEGAGEAAIPDESGYYPTGVYVVGEYIRFIGLVSRHWDSGFANVWTGSVETVDGVPAIIPSNGHLEYINCIGDGNHRTAFAMYSASGVLVRESIAAHSGGSATNSWSSGIQLYAVQGEIGQNVVERSVSFENMDAQKNNDGSGFIADEYTSNAVFVNNIGFGNGGSCMRLTRSPGVSMSHFSCYHNGRNPTPNAPTNPGEFYFTDELSRSGNVFGSLLAASGTPADAQAFVLPPESGFPDNVTLDSGDAVFFTDPEGLNPDFRPPVQAAAQVENAVTGASPDVDIGFDPKCLVRRTPEVPYLQSWWSYSIDYDYIRSIGGVAQCFHPKTRTGGADMGAYELSGSPHQFAVPGSCIPSPIPPDPEDSSTGTDGPSSVPSSPDATTTALTVPPEGSAGTAEATGGTANTTGTAATTVAVSSGMLAPSTMTSAGGTAPTGAVPPLAGSDATQPAGKQTSSGTCNVANPRSVFHSGLVGMLSLGAISLWRRRRT